MRGLALVALSTALVAVAPADARATSCAPTLTWRGIVYHGGFSTRGVDFGPRVGTGLVPACPGPGEPPAPPTTVALLRLTAVRPALAIAPRRERRVYLAEGYVIESPRHPLHRTIFRRGSPSETRGWSCGAAFPRTGRVTNAPPNVLRIGRAQYFVDAATRFGGRLTRHGVPYLGRGMRIRLTATRCTASGGRAKLVARSFSRVGGTGLAG